MTTTTTLLMCAADAAAHIDHAPVLAHRNLNRNGPDGGAVWSVKHRPAPGHPRRLAAHVHGPLLITDATFRVQPAGAAKLATTGRRTVHAYVHGRIHPTDHTGPPAGEGWHRVVYRPALRAFVLADTTAQVTASVEVLLLPDGTCHTLRPTMQENTAGGSG